ncbi:MAG: RnfABCDGE type electron transport complex subunit B [Nitrospirota bacterium]
MISEILIVGGVGLVSGLGLSVASKKLKVEVDPRTTEINTLLPQGNCGACGFPGCMTFAEKVVEGEADLGGCTVGGGDVAKQVAAIMGVELDIDSGEKKAAKLVCRGGRNEAIEKFKYDGVKDCRAAVLISGGSKACIYGCLGLGSCASICPFDAIYMDENGLPVISEERCTACGLCVDVCPKSVIELMPLSKDVQIRCSSKEKGAQVKKVCTVGCIGCGKCVKICPYEAISMGNNLAKIDYEKCMNCGLCVRDCPTKAIFDYTAEREKAVITDKCIGCMACQKACPVNAIAGELKSIHKVNQTKCIGCEICYNKCPKKGAIKMTEV